MTVVLAGLPGVASAAEKPVLKVDPATQDAAPGQEFVVNIIQNATIPTTGAQINILFDQKRIQMKDFELGEAYQSRSAIFAFGNADLGTNATKDLAMGRANQFGTLENAAGFLLPGSGTIPPGDQVFLKLTFIALGGDGGKVTIGLAKGSMIDEVGGPLEPSQVNGAVVVAAGAGPSGPPPASAGASAGASIAPSEAPAVPVSPITPVKVAIAPTSLTLNAGDTARVFLVASADGSLTSVTTDLTFDPAKLEITGLELGPNWEGATVLAVATGGTAGGSAAAIAEANTTGKLQQAGAFFPPGGLELPYGEGVFVSVFVKAKVAGTSSLSVDNAAAIGVSGETIPVEIDASGLTKAADKPLQLDATLIIPLVLLVAIIIAGVLIWRSGRIPVRVRRRAPYYLTLGLGLIPVTMFVALFVTLVINSAPVVVNPGLGALFGTDYSSKFGVGGGGQFGLLPAVWGSVLVAGIAILIALPVSLSLAIVAIDYPLGVITRLVRPLVGLLSGIPPIIYAVSVPIFIILIMIPKFAANTTISDFDPAAVGATWSKDAPPPDVPLSAGGFPWDLTGVNNSTLLGGILIALFLIPFLTPLFSDALRDVPRAAREASLALGANRTYTLRRVILPTALPSLVGASMFGVLKALGDTLIVAFAVGWAAERIPNPALDVLERTSSLAAHGAGLVSSVEALDTSCNPADCAVGYTTALVLLLLAGGFVLAISYLQARGRRRLAI